MACCDVLTLPYRNSEFLDNASSCKIGEYSCMRIPIISTSSNSVKELTSTNQQLHLNNNIAESIKNVLKNTSNLNFESIKWEKISYTTLFNLND